MGAIVKQEEEIGPTQKTDEGELTETEIKPTEKIGLGLLLTFFVSTVNVSRAIRPLTFRRSYNVKWSLENVTSTVFKNHCLWMSTLFNKPWLKREAIVGSSI